MRSTTLLYAIGSRILIETPKAAPVKAKRLRTHLPARCTQALKTQREGGLQLGYLFHPTSELPASTSYPRRRCRV